jgi:hypothetical protein
VDGPASRRVSVPCGTQALHLTARSHRYRALTVSGRPSQTVPLPSALRFREAYNPGRRVCRFGLLRFRSPLLAESSLFLEVLRCFSSPGSLLLRDDGACPPPGFPIRTSPTLAPAHGSSELFAVYHVLHRHLTPRHPPYALICVNAGHTETPGLLLLQPACAPGVLLASHSRLLSMRLVYVVVKLHRAVAGVDFLVRDLPRQRPSTPVDRPCRVISPVLRKLLYRQKQPGLPGCAFPLTMLVTNVSLIRLPQPSSACSSNARSLS